MKFFLPIFLAYFLSLFLGCNNQGKEMAQSGKDSLNAASSSLSFDSERDRIETEDLKWLIKLYEPSIIDSFENLRFEITFYKRLNDSVTYCTYEISDGICLLTYLATQINYQKKAESEIGSGCDADLSHYTYSYTEFELDSTDNTVYSQTITETAKKEFVIKEGQFLRLKEGYTIETAETIIDTVSSRLIIRLNGELKIVKEKN